MITLLKALPGTVNSKDNFDAAWESVVKEMVKTTTAAAIADYSQQKTTLASTLKQQAGYKVMEAIKEKANVVDNRYKFY